MSLKGHTQVSLIFTFNEMVEVQIPGNRTQPTFPIIGQQAFELSGDEPKLVGKPFYVPSEDKPNLMRNHPPRHSVKVKYNFGENEFQSN